VRFRIHLHALRDQPARSALLVRKQWRGIFGRGRGNGGASGRTSVFPSVWCNDATELPRGGGDLLLDIRETRQVFSSVENVEFVEFVDFCLEDVDAVTKTTLLIQRYQSLSRVLGAFASGFNKISSVTEFAAGPILRARATTVPARVTTICHCACWRFRRILGIRTGIRGTFRVPGTVRVDLLCYEYSYEAPSTLFRPSQSERSAS